jgi:hypothetical protein
MCSHLKSALLGLVLGGGANISVVKGSQEGPSYRAYSNLADVA